MKFLEPAYKVSSAVHISTLVHRKHDAARQSLKVMLKDKASTILTTDI